MPFQPKEHNIDFDVLQSHFHLPMAAVAKKFDVCLTFFKKVCRQHGIKRWPYRKLKSLERKMSTDGPQGGDAVNPTSDQQLEGLKSYDNYFTAAHRGGVSGDDMEGASEVSDGGDDLARRSRKRKASEMLFDPTAALAQLASCASSFGDTGGPFSRGSTDSAATINPATEETLAWSRASECATVPDSKTGAVLGKAPNSEGPPTTIRRNVMCIESLLESAAADQ